MKNRSRISFNSMLWKKHAFIIAMLAIPLVHFAFFYIYVNINAFVISFEVPRLDGSGLVDRSFDNYITVLEQFKHADSTIVEVLKNTGMWFVTLNFILMPLSLVICYFIYKQILHYKFFRAIIYLPCIISGTITAALFRYMVGTGGPLFALFDLLGKDYVYIFTDSTYANAGMLFYVLTTGLGGNFILFGGAMNAIPVEQIEAGKLDGCSPWRELVSIIIPNIWPTLSTILLVSFTGILASSGPILLFTRGAYKTNTLSYWIYDLTLEGTNGSSGLAAAVGMLMTIVTLPIVFITKKVTGVTKDD